MWKIYMMPPLDLLTESLARKTIDKSVVEDMRQRIIDDIKKNNVEVCKLSAIVDSTVVRLEFAPKEEGQNKANLFLRKYTRGIAVGTWSNPSDCASSCKGYNRN